MRLDKLDRLIDVLYPSLDGRPREGPDDQVRKRPARRDRPSEKPGEKRMGLDADDRSGCD